MCLLFPLLAAADVRYNKVLYLDNKPSAESLSVPITLTGADADQLPAGAEPKLADTPETAKSATKVVFTWKKDADKPASGGERTLNFTAAIRSLAKGDDGKPREAELTLGAKKIKIAYNVVAGPAPPAAAPPAKTAWTAMPMVDPWVLSGLDAGEKCTSLAINPGSENADGVKLFHSTLSEETTKKHLALGLFSITGDNSPIQFVANRPTSLRLCLKDSSHPGVFKGNLYLAADNKSDVLAIPMNIQASLIWYKLLGLLVLAFGVILAVIVIPFTRAAGLRDQQLLRAARRRPELTSLLGDLDQLPPNERAHTLSTREMVHSTLDSLSANNLEKLNFLPPAEPSPLTATVDAAGFDRFLGTVDSTIANLTQIVRQGILIASGEAATEPAKETAIAAIDALSRTANAAALTDIQAAITTALQPLAPVAAAMVAAAENADAGVKAMRAWREKSTAQLEKDLRRRRFWLNAAVVLLTVVSGALVLITPKMGFGIAQDYFFCFLWGFGLPIAGQQLTPAAVRNVIAGS
jgi:hypothetical protein